MSRNSELAKNTFWISMAQIMAQAVNFLFIPLYTAVLSTAGYGKVDLYATIRTILAYVLFCGLEQSIFRFCISESNMSKKQEFFSIGVMMSAGLALIYSFLYWIGNTIWNFQYAQLVYAYYFFYGIFYLMLQIARGLGRIKVYAAASTLGTIFTVLLNFIFVVCLKYGVRGVLLGNAISYAVVNIYMIFKLPLRKMFVFKWEKGTAGMMLQYSYPLVLNNVMGWVATSSDKLIVVAILGNEMNGIYALANKVNSIMWVLTNGFLMAWAEMAIKVMKQPDYKEYYQKIIDMSMDAFFIISSGMIVILPFLFNHFINKEYMDAYYHIPIIVYATFCYAMSSVIGYILLAYKKSAEVGIATLGVGIINLAVHFLLIGRIGLFAASVSTLVSYAGLFAFRYLFMERCEKIFFPWKNALIQLGVYLVLCGCYYLKGKGSMLMAVLIYAAVVIVLMKKHQNVLNGVLVNIKVRIKERLGGN